MVCSPTARAAGTSADPAPTRAAMVGTTLVGTVRVIDGDTIAVTGKGWTYSVRLFGIDTPERGAQGFTAATDTLSNFIGKPGVVACLIVDVDRYHRPVGLCRTHDINPLGRSAGTGGPDEHAITLNERMLRTCRARLLPRWFHRVTAAMQARLRAAASGCR